MNPAAEIKRQLNPFEKAAADVRAGLDSLKPAAPKPVAELNGEPVYGERVDPTDTDADAAKRKTED